MTTSIEMEKGSLAKPAGEPFVAAMVSVRLGDPVDVGLPEIESVLVPCRQNVVQFVSTEADEHTVVGRLGEEYEMCKEHLFVGTGNPHFLKSLEMISASGGQFAHYHLGQRNPFLRDEESKYDILVTERWLKLTDNGGLKDIAEGCFPGELNLPPCTR
ncbi:MAG: hypothetical protein NTY93_03400 [Candidatus Kaiserbacteria bacterium]|nr:hypothetical protein [Candidatus Kaiserbacteria bacterium]